MDSLSRQTKKSEILIFSILSISLSVLYITAFSTEKDVVTYFRYLSSCDISEFPIGLTSSSIFLLLEAPRLAFCTLHISPLLLVAPLNLWFLILLYKSIRHILPRVLAYILILNPLSLTWLTMPSKDSFILASILLVLHPRVLKQKKLTRILILSFASIIILTIRPFLIILVPLMTLNIIGESSFYRLSVSRAFKSKNFLLALLIGVSAYFYFFFPLQHYFLNAAQLSLEFLENNSLSNLYVFSTPFAYLNLGLNYLRLPIFSLFSSSQAYLGVLLANLFLLYVLYRVSSRYQLHSSILYGALYIAPYSLTLSNSGAALRVLFVGIIMTLISRASTLARLFPH